jgi:hypothetical protein
MPYHGFEGRGMKEREVRGEGGLPMSLQFDGKSNWKAFYAKFSRYAEVSEWTEGDAGTSYAGAWMGKLVSIMPYWWNETMIILLPSSISSRGFGFSSGGVARPVPTTR